MSTGGSKPARGCRWVLAPGHPACSEEERGGASPGGLEVTEPKMSGRDLSVRSWRRSDDPRASLKDVK